MKRTNSKPSPRRTQKSVVPVVVRKPFSNPIPLQDQLTARFGPRNPIPANKQFLGNN